MLQGNPVNPDIHEVIAVGAGRLYVMPRPRSKWLKEDVDYFSKIKINVVVSHLEKDEENELGLSDEEKYLYEAGIEFISYPIKDMGLPQVDDFSDFIERMYRKLLGGKNVAIHCRAGIGRTGITSSCVLIRGGYASTVAMNMVAAARGAQIPDTTEQFEFIHEFSLSIET
jgi:protein-tyrosine phosphatase